MFQIVDKYAKPGKQVELGIHDDPKQDPDRDMVIILHCIMAAQIKQMNEPLFSLVKACMDVDNLVVGKGRADWISEDADNLGYDSLLEFQHAMQQYTGIMLTEKIYYFDALRRVMPS